MTSKARKPAPDYTALKEAVSTSVKACGVRPFKMDVLFNAPAQKRKAEAIAEALTDAGIETLVGKAPKIRTKGEGIEVFHPKASTAAIAAKAIADGLVAAGEPGAQRKNKLNQRIYMVVEA